MTKVGWVVTKTRSLRKHVNSVSCSNGGTLIRNLHIKAGLRAALQAFLYYWRALKRDEHCRGAETRVKRHPSDQWDACTVISSPQVGVKKMWLAHFEYNRKHLPSKILFVLLKNHLFPYNPVSLFLNGHAMNLGNTTRQSLLTYTHAV